MYRGGGGYDVYPETRVPDSMQDIPVCAVAAGCPAGHNTIELERNQVSRKTDGKKTKVAKCKAQLLFPVLQHFYCQAAIMT